MRYATFYNFTNKSFTGYWNGKAYTFNPGAKKEHLHENIAGHFAKHLANQVLTDNGKEQYTSPKKPLEVPQFMEVYNKAFILEGNGRDIDAETGLPVDENTPEEPSMNIRTVPRMPINPMNPNVDPYDARANQVVGPGSAPQIIGTEIGAGDEEDSFEGKGEDE